MKILKSIILELLSENSLLNRVELAKEINSLNIFHHKVTETRLSNCFKQMGYSFRIPVYKNANKYSNISIDRYEDFLILASTVDWDKIYFTDECTFSSRDLRRRRALGPVDQDRVVAVKEILSETYNGFFAISHFGQISFKLRDETNDTLDFISFLGELLKDGFFEVGSILILDNAPIHGGVDALPFIYELFESYGCYIAFLPTYSPELNPIELLFGFIKNKFYNSRTFSKEKFLDQLTRVIGSVPPEVIKTFYKKSLGFTLDEGIQKIIAEETERIFTRYR
ncbi:hypothetical protein ACTFIY_007052 [Dictyostelium cf. discoideum]